MQQQGKIPQQTIDIIRLLLSDLINPTESRLGMMGSDAVTSQLIPQELKFERSVMDSLFRCEEKQLAPSVENVSMLMLTTDPDNLRKVQELASKSNPVPMIRASSIWVRAWSEQELLSQAANEVESISKTDYADVGEKRDRMLDALINLPIADTNQSYTRIEMMDYFEEEQRKRVERKSKGQALGAVLHLEALRDSVPVLGSGDMTLVTAPPKSGKTSSCMILANYNAHENDTDVLVLLLETSPTTIEERELSRDLLIPGKALRDGAVDLSKPPYKANYESYKATQRLLWDTKGRIYLQYIAGSKLSEITTQIRIHKRLADARNRPLLVIIDYLQRIQKASNKTEVEAIAMISNFVKDLAVRYECHIILFSQESFTGTGRDQGDSRAHGSNTPIFVAQVHMAIKVLNANTDQSVQDYETGEIAVNALGQKRYWQYVGKQKRQSIMRFDILRANNDDTTQAYMAIENPLFIHYDISKTPLDKLPLFMKQQVESFQQSLSDPERRLI